jgi:thiol:disulfide interchange protein
MSELSRIGRSGVPTYIIISDSNKKTTHVLPELLTRGVVLHAIRRAST